MFGNHVQGKLDSIDAKNEVARNREQARILGELLALPVEQRFRPFRTPGG